MNNLKEALKNMDLPCDAKTIEKFRLYMEGVLQWNEKVNLTRITEPDEFVSKHFIDSILCCGFDEFKSADRIIDVGTGGGFPGVPLAIVSPDKEYVLMDALNKRLKIINELCQKAEIHNVITVHSRAEDLAVKKEYRQNFDLCVSRAVASSAVLAEYCLPFIRKGGYFLAYKGPDVYEEAKEAEKAIRILGGELIDIRDSSLKNFGIDHKIMVIKKIKDTPAKYPRKAGTPSKIPLK